MEQEDLSRRSSRYSIFKEIHPKTGESISLDGFHWPFSTVIMENSAKVIDEMNEAILNRTILEA
jgi:hypothetical protein